MTVTSKPQSSSKFKKTLKARLNCMEETYSAGARRHYSSWNVLFYINNINISIVIPQASKLSEAVQREKQRDTKQRTRLSGGKDMRLFSQFAGSNMR